MRNRLLAAGAALVLALPALAQDRPESLLPPGFGEPANTATPTPSPSPAASPGAAAAPGPAEGAGVVMSSSLEPGLADETALAEVAPPVELPDSARRDPALVGVLPPADLGLPANPWGATKGRFLSVLMRRMDTPLASRWGHILLRNTLLAQAPAAIGVVPADWTAERAWLLIRMGEADAARMLVSGTDVADFTPKMAQVAMQSALATADPSGLCPLRDDLARVERRVLPLIEAMCASLSGNSAVAAAGIEQARRSGRFESIDLALADKVVGAGADTARSVTVEWDPVQRINAWRFGLATATGMVIPAKLIDPASPQVRAWQARAPMLSPADRLASARIATGLGVFSSQALIDLYALIYAATDPSDLGATDAWQARLAFAADTTEERLAAIRKLIDGAKGPVEKEAVRALLGRAALRIEPDPELQDIAPELIAALLAAGFDRQAARWTNAVERMDDKPADRCWAMLALATPKGSAVSVSTSRIGAFLDRDKSPGRQRGALLVAGLAGIGKIDADAARRLDERFELGLALRNDWTRLIDEAAARRDAGAVAILAGSGLQASGFERVPGAHLLHIARALSASGQAFAARMIAAEALSRT